MTYAKVINNEIVEYNRTLPFSIEEVSFGIGSTDEELRIYGYLPIIGTEPEYDRNTHKNNGVRYEIVGNEIHKIYDIVTISVEELLVSTKARLEDEVQNHINSVVKGLGYDNENSIAKYLVQGNPFYDECKALSLWIGAVWVFANNLQNEVALGTTTIPSTTQEFVELLPKYVR